MSKSIGPYILGDLLGKGGFGSVYKSINSETGDTVAIKLIGKAGITKDKIASIKSEISLLRKLNHPNIVKYVDQRQTTEHLAIIIEYIENGSLAGLVKKYGKMKEILVAKFVQQLLTGLKYLHSEGVIHRDIKGANILTTKDSIVKLADFGISGHLSDMDSNDVVGTPYWMAPEIIELGPPTTASDIWSVGCTIIELIGGAPPYFDLPPMSALYRIVSDDHPPLPSDSGTPISAPLRDFLIQCFHKDPNLRATATKLLSHAWIKGVNRISDVPLDPGQYPAERPEGSGDKKRRHHSRRKKDGESSSSSSSRRKHRSSRHTHEDGSSTSKGDSESSTKPEAQPSTSGASSQSSGLSLAERLKQKTAAQAAANEEEPNWDADEPAETPKKETTKPKSTDADDWDAEAGIEPAEKPKGGLLQLPTKTPTKEKKRVTIADSEPQPASTGLSLADRLKAKTSAPPTMDDENLDWDDNNNNTTPRKGKVNIRASSVTKAPPSTSTSTAGKLKKYQDDDENFDDIAGELASKLKSGKATVKPGMFARSTSLISGIKPAASTAISKYKESQEDEDYDDLVFGKKDIFERAGSAKKVTNLASKLKMKMAAAWDSAEVDPFQEDEDEEAAFEDIVEVGFGKISEGEQAEMRIKELQQNLKLERPENEIIDACHELIEMFNEHPSYRNKLISHYGVIPIMELLELSNSDGLRAVLQLVNKLIDNNQTFQETLCLVGALPTIMKFSNPRFSTEIRREASIFISEITHASPLTLQMFIASRGLPVLVKFLEHADEEFNSLKSIIYVALNGILQVFNIPESRTPKKDFCRLFAKDKVMYPLSRVLVNAANEYKAEKTEEIEKQLKKVSDIMFTLSQSTDAVVRQHMAEEIVLQRVFTALPLMPTVSKVAMLKTIKNITADSNGRENFQRVGAIPVLVSILGHSDIKADRVALSALVHSLYNLTRLSKERQEIVAVSGVVPYLLDIFENSTLRSGLGQFILSIMFDFAHAGKRTREELWKSKVINFYIKMLDARFERASALKSIAVWLAEETKDVQAELIKPDNLEKLASAINTDNYSACLPIYEKLLATSEKVGYELGKSKFVGYLVHAIETCPSSDPRSHTNLLKILVLIYKYHANPKELIAEHDLYAVIMRVYNRDTKVLVKTMASDLLKTFDTNLKV